MFKSIECLSYIGKDPKTNLYSYLFKITDDDFEEEAIGTLATDAVDTATFVAGAAGGVLINCYENRNLNVPKNLLKLFMFYEKKYRTNFYSIQRQISWCIKYQPLFLKYKNEVEKYLLLL